MTTQIEQAARYYARKIEAEFLALGETLTEEEMVRWIREQQPRIPEHIALEQLRWVRRGN